MGRTPMTGAVARPRLGIWASYYTVSYYKGRSVYSGVTQPPLDPVRAKALQVRLAAPLSIQAMSRSAFTCWLISKATTAITMKAVEMVVRR